MKTQTRPGRFQIPRLIKPLTKTNEAPFEKYAHFVVAPSFNPDKTSQSNINNSKLNNSTKISKEKVRPPSPSTGTFTTTQFPQTEPPPNTPQADQDVDTFIINALETSICAAAEKFFLQRYNAASVVYWEDIPSLKQLYSPTNSLLSSYNGSLPGFSFYSRAILRTRVPTLHPNYSSTIDARIVPQDAPLMIFPLFTHRGQLCSVIEIVKTPSSPEFTEADESFIQYFSYKFILFSRFLLEKQVQEPILLDILQLTKTFELIPKMTTQLANFFDCRICEIWMSDKVENSITRFTEEDPTGINIKECGIVKDALEKVISINCQSTKAHPSYNVKIDTSKDEALIIMPVTEKKGRFVIATVLRGPMNKIVFTNEDEINLRKMAPFIATSIINATSFSNIDSECEKGRTEREGLAALLEVAEVLSGQLDTERLTSIIMEKGRLLTNSDRCSLFLVNSKRDRLITSFQHGLDSAIDIPIDKGIAGETVKEGRLLNIPDAYDNPNFDSSTDLETGYRTRSILSVPIFNNKGDVIGVTEMVNKQDGSTFSREDENMIQIFNVFCGISLVNAQLYRESIDMSSQLRTFFDVAFSLSQSESIQRILQDIIHNARVAIDAESASLFLVDNQNQVLNSFIVDGGKLQLTLPMSAGIAGYCATSKQSVVCNKPYEDPRFNRTVDISNNFTTNTLCVAPVLSSTGQVLGVVEMVNKNNGVFNDNDMQMLKSMTIFAGVSLENSKLKDSVMTGVEAELNRFINIDERGVCSTPKNLQLTREEQNEASNLSFFTIDWKGDRQIKLLFYLFNKFNLLTVYKVSNEMFFRYIYELRSRYNEVPYHNWIHACDVTQYVSYEISTAKLETVLTSLELFSMLVAATGHDTNHNGFNNVYNEKAQTPLGILFKENSVMETHHCTQIIEILTNENFNLMHSLNLSDTNKMWTIIIKLILATDMAHHFNMVKKMGEVLDNGLDWNDNEHRLLVMQMLLKVSDISNVSRPFEIADKWCDVLNVEFFRQGDLEKQIGIGLTSPLNDREHPDKPKSQIGFYNFICLPLYTVVARAFPALEVNANSVKSNLEKWKELAKPPEKKD